MSSPGISVAREVDLDRFVPGPSASPHDSSSTSSTSDIDSDSESDTNDTATPDQDGAARLYHVYAALMASLLPPITTTTTLHHPDEQPTTTDDNDAAARETFSALASQLEEQQQADAAADAGNAGANAVPGIKNAKRRKMDKKKAKREEQKLHAAEEEEAVDVVDFKLFSRQRVKPISLLPAQEPTWHVPNPRHVPLTEQQLRALRDRIGSVAVDGNGVRAAGAGAGARTGERRKVQRVYVVEGEENDHEKGMNIVHLSAPRDHVPPFSAAYLVRHPSYRPPPVSTFSKPLPATHPQNSKNNPSTNAPTGRGATPIHTIQAALKRSTMQKKQRAAAHIVFTAHTKPLPFHTPAAARALAALATGLGTDTTDPAAAHPSGKVAVLDVLSPAAAAAVQENKERKAHLRRIARRTARINVTSAANSPTAGVGAVAAAGTKPTQRPWTLPSASASASNASFYAPPEDLGGKSAGYGWGYAASRPGVREWEAARRKGGL